MDPLPRARSPGPDRRDRPPCDRSARRPRYRSGPCRRGSRPELAHGYLPARDRRRAGRDAAAMDRGYAWPDSSGYRVTAVFTVTHRTGGAVATRPAILLVAVGLLLLIG